jgi:hypothetical protein
MLLELAAWCLIQADVHGLASDSWEQREASSRRLVYWGQLALPHLQKSFKDIEQAARARRLVLKLTNHAPLFEATRTLQNSYNYNHGDMPYYHLRWRPAPRSSQVFPHPLFHETYTKDPCPLDVLIGLAYLRSAVPPRRANELSFTPIFWSYSLEESYTASERCLKHISLLSPNSAALIRATLKVLPRKKV